jgi:hypothetical protein
MDRYLQSGGIHGQSLGAGAPLFWDNILMANEGWEVYSDLPLFDDNVDYDLGYDASDPVKIFSPRTNPGPNSLVADPRFVNPVCGAGNPWAAFDLRSGSPGRGTASDGLNRGAVFPLPGGSGLRSPPPPRSP